MNKLKRLTLTVLLLALGFTSAFADIRTMIGFSIPQHGGGAALTANVYAPDAALAAGPYPVISMLPGGGAPLSSVEWAAQRLARDGYVVCLTLPEASTESEYDIACRSGIDFLASAANPFLAECDNTRVGICGWSLGGRSLTKTQEEDPRVKCVVAWDNLAVSEKGDGGSPLGSNRPQLWRTPRVPAMGQASLNGFTNSECKITAWKWWREWGKPCMEVVFENSNHFWWSGNSTEEQRNKSHHYTLAWFDRWLKNDPTAKARLLATNVVGQPVNLLLSAGLRSAAFFDGLDTADLKAHLVTGAGTGSVKSGRPARWVCAAGTAADNEVARAIDCDSAGNIYTVGSFQGSISFVGPVGSQSLGASAGAEDIFVVKNAPDGSFIWARRYGGTGRDLAYDVNVDSAGRVFVCGTFQNSFSIGAFTVSTPAGTTSTFTAQLDSDGNAVWAGVTGAATIGSVLSSELIADGTGGFIVCGGFSGTAVFGEQTITTGAGETWTFIARYDASRALQWVATATGAFNSARGLAFALDGSGDVLATGQFSGSADFGTTTLAAAGDKDAWLARLTSAGAWRWVKQAGGTGEDYGRGVAATAGGYATSGSFRNTNVNVFGAGMLSSLGGRDIYVAKFDWNDNPLWLQRLGGASDDEGAEISAMPDGGFLLCGSFAGSITFGAHTQTSGGARDMLVARLQPDGSPDWLAGTMGGADDDVGYACAADALGNAYFAGFYKTIAPFGYDVAVSPTRSTSPGQAEIVWGKIHATSEPYEDTDGDGQSNAAELASGTDPLNPAQSLRITQFTHSAGHVTITWQSVTGRTYRVQQSGDLKTWTDLATLTATATTSSYTTNTSHPQRFYRVATP
jgi:hypothetical protein